MDKVAQFIMEYIQREYTVPEEQDLMALNYVESGYVDSISLIQFITTLEDEFSIEFSNDELENPDTKVVGKLIDLIKEKMKG